MRQFFVWYLHPYLSIYSKQEFFLEKLETFKKVLRNSGLEKGYQWRLLKAARVGKDEKIVLATKQDPKAVSDIPDSDYIYQTFYTPSLLALPIKLSDLGSYILRIE